MGPSDQDEVAPLHLFEENSMLASVPPSHSANRSFSLRMLSFMHASIYPFKRRYSWTTRTHIGRETAQCWILWELKASAFSWVVPRCGLNIFGKHFCSLQQFLPTENPPACQYAGDAENQEFEQSVTHEDSKENHCDGTHWHCEQMSHDLYFWICYSSFSKEKANQKGSVVFCWMLKWPNK